MYPESAIQFSAEFRFTSRQLTFDWKADKGRGSPSSKPHCFQAQFLYALEIEDTNNCKYLSMTSLKPPLKKSMKTNLQEPSNSWIFLLKEQALDLSEHNFNTGNPVIVTLRHPNGEGSATFLLSPENDLVQEILTFTDGTGSWFLDESVKSNGKMYLSTPIDPLFLVLPYFQKHCSSQAIPLNQLLRDEEYPETQRLLNSSGLKYLNMISDRKGDEELQAYKYNEDKTLRWLKQKTRRVAEIIKQRNIHLVGGGATSSTFIESSESDFNEYLRFAHEIVSEYLMDDLGIKLLKFLDLPENPQTQLGSKRKSELMLTNPKKCKTEENVSSSSRILGENKAEIKLPRKTIQQLSKDKARTRAAAGSKTIGSFFKKT